MTAHKPHQTLFMTVFAPQIVKNFLLFPDGVLAQLKKHGMRIVLLVPTVSYEKMKEDFEDEHVHIEPVAVTWKHKNIFETIYFFFATHLIFTEGGRLFASMGVRLDKPVAGGKRFLYPLKIFIANTLGKSRFVKHKLFPWLDGLVHRERPYRELFETYRPDAVFLTDILNKPDVAVLREAKRQEIRAIGMPTSWDHFPKRFEPLQVDSLLVWAEPFKEEAVALHGYAPKHVSMTGIPQYDIFSKREYLVDRETFCKGIGLDPQKKLIAFFGGSSYAPDDGDIVDILVKGIKDGSLPKDAQLLIRPYPAAFGEEKKFEIYRNESFVYLDETPIQKVFPQKGNRWYPTIASAIHLMNLLYHADVIINTYSSVSVEASVFLKSAININFDGYQKRPFKESIKRFKHLSHYHHVFKTGGVLQAESSYDLIRFVNELLNNPTKNQASVEKLRDTMCWKVDGKASERIVQAILATMGVSI